MENINTKIEFWKSRLLDLSKRNRLINCPLPKSGKRVSRTFLLINQPDYAALWAQLSESDRPLEFPIPLDVEESEKETNESLFGSVDIDILTNQTPNEMHKTLRSIMKKAKEFQEEKGLNALYLAFGFLNWRENGKEGQEMRSPLVLMPVKLTQEDLFSPIILSHLDEEITTNYSLEQRLLNDFGIELPRLTDDADLDDYLDGVRQAIGALGWNVETNVTQLSLLSFAKINMYRDMERNCHKITEHHVVRSLNGEAIKDGVSVSDLVGYNHDCTDPKEVFSVVDADSSQQDAILLAKRGVSFVLQGPPGTGKSQTITNIIAELIAEGRKVLFVSEKMAALEVVYKRLSQAGLADFCLTLHSHNAKRREILNQFDRSLKISRQRVNLQQDAFDKLYRLKETRNSLNQYSAELHTLVKPLEKTVYQINGLMSKLEDYPNIDYVQEGVEKFTPELLAQCEIALEELTRVVEKSGYQQNSPWNGCVLEQLPTYEFRQRFLVESETLITQIEAGLSILSETNDIMDNHDLNWAWSSISSIYDIFNVAKQSPGVSVDWMSLNLQLTISDIDACASYIKNCAALEVDLLALKETKEIINNAAQNETSIQCGQAIDDDVSSVINEYNAALETREAMKEAKTNLEAVCKVAGEKLLSCAKAFESEQSKQNTTEAEWQIAQKSLFRRCAESVLSLDAARMLARYRTEYRSWLRTLNSAYRNDRSSLLAHCKTAEKLIYEQGLALLDVIVATQDLKAAFDKQVEITACAKTLLDSVCYEHNNVSEKLAAATVALSNAESDFDVAKTMLAHTLSKGLSECEQRLNEKKRKFPHLQQRVSLKQALCVEIAEDTDFNSLRTEIDWCVEFQKLLHQHHLGNRFVNDVCGRKGDIFDRADSNIAKLQDWKNRITPSLARFAELFDEQRKQSLCKASLKELLIHIVSCKENFAALEYLIDYRIAHARLKELGIDSYLEKAKEIDLGAGMIVPVFRKCFFRSWLDAIIPRFTTISEFRRLRQNERITLFKDLDKSCMEISKAMLISKLISRLPNFDAISSNGEVALLRREMAKQRKLMPTRKLIAALPNLLPALKPCVMMSPLSVSTYLGESSFEFNTVIFDEASQVRTEDAIGAIIRAEQVIIAGDSKQLPPTDFFNTSISSSDDFEEDEDGEANDSGAFESLLDEATLLPTQTLLWHYRSRHEHLIAFSNSKIYQGNLITFPSCTEKTDGAGVEYIHVVDGTYDRGGRNGNRAEAGRVAELAFEHFRQYPKRTLGIIAFGEVQQTAILDALIERRKANPTFEPFFREDKEESIFIKNLETVQGDERDTIIFSIGYAPDSTGKFFMNFGPLSRNGGERRLNVAVTRARYNLKLVGSILPTDIDIERTSGEGPKLLRQYIDFAINGATALLGEVTSDNASWFDSPFETSVYQFLTKHGYAVATQVGCSGYRIDLAVRHPSYNGRFAIGVECDGAMYHSARTARERDRLRQTVLEDMGWKIYRIWSTDWIKDRHTEGRRLLAAVRQAVDNYHETAPTTVDNSKDKMTDFLNVTTVSVGESVREGTKQKCMALRSDYFGYQAKEIPTSDFAATMVKVLQNNFGLDRAGLFKEATLYGYGWERQGSVIKKKLEAALTALLKKKKISIGDDRKIKLVE